MVRCKNRNTSKSIMMATMAFCTLGGQLSFAQEGKIGINTASPNATLEIIPLERNLLATATTNEGLIIPRMSKTRVANITTPVESTLIYVNDVRYTSSTEVKNARVEGINEVGYYYYNGTKWVKGMGIDQMGATNGQVLKWNGTAWAPAADANTNTIYTGSASVILSGTSFQRAALTGDVTAVANSNATTISNNAVTNAKIADNSITSAKIVNGTILAEDLAQMGATNGQVLKWNGTAWVPAADANTTYTAGTGISISNNQISTTTPIRTVTANTTLEAIDNGGYVYVNSTNAINITVPSSLPAGFSCIVVQKGTGQVTVIGSGVTLQTARGTKTRTQFSAIGIIKDTTATATITGDAIR